MPKKKYFITTFALVELCICLIFFAWYLIRTSDIIEDVAKEKLALAQDIIEIKLENTNAYIEASLDFMGMYIDRHASDDDDEIIRELFNLYTKQERIKELASFYEIVWISNRKQKHITIRQDNTMPSLVDNIEVEILKNKCRHTPSTIRFGKLVKVDRKTINTFCYGVIDRKGDYIGTLVAGIHQSEFEENLQKSMGNETISFAIYNKESQIIYESLDKFISTIYGNKIVGLFSNMGAPSDTYEKIGGFTPFDRKVAYIHYDNTLALKYVVITNDNFHTKTIHDKTGVLVVDLAFLLLAAAIITVFVYKKLVRPVIDLSNQTKHMASGNANIIAWDFGYIELDNLSKAISKLAEQQKLQEENRKLHFLVQKAEEANQAKTEFIRHMQHEFRTPLNHIIGSTDVLTAGTFGGLPQEMRQYIDNINKSGKTLLQSINGVIHFADYLSGKIKLKEELCNLKKVITDVLDKYATRIASLDISLKIDISPVLPLIFIDRLQFSEAMEYIIDNAIKFNKEGGVIDVSAHQGEDDSIILIVKDTGVGISQAHLEKLSRTFNGDEDNFIKLNKGIGLGLGVAGCIFDLHSIKFKIEGTAGVGTIVTLTIPDFRIREV